MTTIVYRDGIIAADSRAYSGCPTPIGNKCKLFVLEDESVIGISTTEPGQSETIAEALNKSESYQGAEPILQELKFQALRVLKDGSVFYYCDSMNPSGPLTQEYFAIGSGDHYALGAMSQGARAVDAVLAASVFDPYTNDVITAYEIGPKSSSS